jgi:predicted SAM-dependent methyltransferase
MSAATPETFDPARHPRKLNLGCGTDLRQGYVNVDMNAWHNPDVLADVRNTQFLPTGFYDEILANDVLEHLPRTDTLNTLVQWNRPLRMGGILELRVPSVLGVADLLSRRENQAPAKQEELIQCLFGTQAYTGDFHFTSFTKVLLEHYLEKAGFRTLRIDLQHGWLFEVRAEKVRHMDAQPIRDFQELLGIDGDEEFVRTCYREILVRDADSGGLDFFLNGLRGGGMTRKSVIDIMRGSPEYTTAKRG